MTTRRQFLRSLGIGVAALYLRIAPEKVRTLGLLGISSDVRDGRFVTYRRSVYYQYPLNSAPLTGLLSLMKDDTQNDPKFNWWKTEL